MKYERQSWQELIHLLLPPRRTWKVRLFDTPPAWAAILPRGAFYLSASMIRYSIHAGIVIRRSRVSPTGGTKNPGIIARGTVTMRSCIRFGIPELTKCTKLQGGIEYVENCLHSLRATAIWACFPDYTLCTAAKAILIGVDLGHYEVILEIWLLLCYDKGTMVCEDLYLFDGVDNKKLLKMLERGFQFMCGLL